VTFRQQLLSSSNCCLLSSARGRHRKQQIVVEVAELVGPLVSVHDTLTLLSNLDCLANPPCSLVWLTGDDRGLVPVDDVIFVVAWSVIADLFCSDCDCFLETITIRTIQICNHRVIDGCFKISMFNFNVYINRWAYSRNYINCQCFNFCTADIHVQLQAFSSFRLCSAASLGHRRCKL